MKRFEDLDLQGKKAVLGREYHRKSWMESLGNEGFFEFDIGKSASLLRQGIIDRMEEAAGISLNGDLEHAHRYLSEEEKQYRPEDKRNIVSTYFFDMPDSFVAIYQELLKDQLPAEIADAPFYFQSIPNIRVQTPGPSFAEAFPSFHTDICLGHHPREINIWIPLTKVMSGHGFKIMNLKKSRDAVAGIDYDLSKLSQHLQGNQEVLTKSVDQSWDVSTDFGRALAFDGRCIHSTIPIQHQTRVSIDIRVIPIRDYESLDYVFTGYGNRPMDFAPGDTAESSQQLKAF